MARISFPRWLVNHMVWGIILGFYGTILLVFGLIGYLTPAVVLGSACCSTAIALIIIRFGKSSEVLAKEPSKVEKILFAGNLSIVALTLFQGLVPPHERDALIHHLAIPAWYLRSRTIFDIPFAEQAYNPMLGDLFFFLPLVLAKVFPSLDSLANWIHYAFGLGVAHLLYCFMAHLYDRKTGLIASLLFLLLPVVVQSGSQSYVDLIITYYCLLSWLCIYFWFESVGAKDNFWPLLFISGMMSGFSLACKYNGYLLLPFTLLVLFFGMHRLGFAARRMGVAFCFFLFPVIFVNLPWCFRDYSWTGNPVYPFFRSWLGWRGIPVEALDEIPALFHRYKIYNESLGEILALPLRIFLTGSENDPRQFDGRLSPLLLLLIPFAFFAKDSKTKLLVQGMGFLTLFYFLYVAFFRVLRIRYLLPIVPPMVILSVVGWNNTKGVLKQALGFAVGSALILHFYWCVERLQKREVFPYLLGRLTREEYLSQRLPEYPVQLWANVHLRPTDKILFVLLGDRGYYCEIPYIYDFHDPGRSWRRWLKSSAEVQDLRKRIKEEGITHLIAPAALLHDAIGVGFWYTSEQEEVGKKKKILLDFFQMHTRVIFQSGQIQLFEIL